jgi:hypothetical protein
MAEDSRTAPSRATRLDKADEIQIQILHLQFTDLDSVAIEAKLHSSESTICSFLK